MTPDDLDMEPAYTSGSEEPRSLSTRGGMARKRRSRIIALVLLSLLLAALAYAAYYYSQNRRLPSVRLTTAGQEAVKPPQYLYSFSGASPNGMNQPSGVAVIGTRCYVTDYAYRNVTAYTVDGTFLFRFGAIKDGASTRMGSPVHLAVGPGNTIWVTDRALRAIYVFDQDGKFLRKFVPNGDAKFDWGPLALTFDKAGNLYVTDVGDTLKHQVLVFDPAGRLKAQWGSSKQVTTAAQDTGKFYFPNGIAVSGAGTQTVVYVADGNNRRVQVFQPDGTFIRVLDTSGTPRGVAVDSQSRLFMVDALAHRVDLYDVKGDMLATFGERGTGPGQFSFPNDITFDSRGRAFIADRNNNQVQVWGPLAAEIPGVTQITPNNAWVPFVLAALVALTLLLLSRRRRRFAVTPDFVAAMAAMDAVEVMSDRRFRWMTTEDEYGPLEGGVAGGMRLDELITEEPFSESDAGSIREKLGVTVEQSRVLALATWARTLCTQDIELARYAVRLGIDVYDARSWLQQFGGKKR